MRIHKIIDYIMRRANEASCLGQEFNKDLLLDIELSRFDEYANELLNILYEEISYNWYTNHIGE